MILGKERNLSGSIVVLAKKLHRAPPGRLLHAIEFAKVEHMTLGNAPVKEPTVFDHTPVVVRLAILEPFQSTKEHDGQ
jgi:hypothetical protein